jgi:hypothetical protein
VVLTLSELEELAVIIPRVETTLGLELANAFGVNKLTHYVISGVLNLKRVISAELCAPPRSLRLRLIQRRGRGRYAEDAKKQDITT